ncbi:MAG: serine protease [Chromatiaceae bacterium]|nr:serine protease [Chromatiaceae bacterium]
MGKLPDTPNNNYTSKPTIGRSVRRTLALPLCLAGVLLCRTAWPANLADTIDAVRPSVVAVGIFQPSGSPRQQFRGTGFVVANGHLVVTNQHVLPEKLDDAKREQIAVFSGRGRSAHFHPAKVVARDAVHDLALLYISTPLPALKLAGADRLREGSEIAFTGFPIGMALGLYPVTHHGIVSAISPMAPPQIGSQVLSAQMIRAMRDPYDVLQLDATAYPGNSGSPVFDQQTGHVVGVINSVLVKGTKEAAIEKPSGISYAIPVEFVRELLKQAPQ